MADYTIKLDNQGEQLMAIAVKDWIKANTVTTNVVTKKIVDGKEVEVTTPTETIPKMNKVQLIQKLVDDKMTEVYNKVKADETSSIQQKYEALTEDKKAQVKQILGVK